MKAKKVAIYLMKRFSNLINNKIGETFGLTYSAVSKAAADIEKLITEDKTVKKEVDGLISHFKV